MTRFQESNNELIRVLDIVKEIITMEKLIRR